MNIIVPMAHPDDMVDSLAEYQYPKPLIDLHGKPIIQYVIDNLLQIKGVKKIYFIVKASTCEKYHIDNVITLLCPKSEIIYLKNTTSGSVSSILMGIDQIPLNEECVIVNSDQILLNDLNEVVAQIKSKKMDGCVLTFNSVHPRWSYALTEDEYVVQLAEKNPISKNAIAGFYYFKSFDLFVTNAYKTILDDDSLNGVFYVSSVFNQLILQGKKVQNIEIPSNKYLSLYSVQKIKEFEAYLNEQKVNNGII